jgi:hypothetical protein
VTGFASPIAPLSSKKCPRALKPAFSGGVQFNGQIARWTACERGWWHLGTYTRVPRREAVLWLRQAWSERRRSRAPTRLFVAWFLVCRFPCNCQRQWQDRSAGAPPLFNRREASRQAHRTACQLETLCQLAGAPITCQVCRQLSCLPRRGAPHKATPRSGVRTPQSFTPPWNEFLQSNLLRGGRVTG